MLKRKTPLKTKTGFKSRPSSLATKKTERPTLQQMKGSGLVQKASSFTQKSRKKLKPRAANNAGWVDVAEAIWNKSDNSRCCEVCGCFLGDDFSPTFYHHLLHRGSYRSLKREPRNLAQVCPTHHDMAHEYGIETLATQGSPYVDGWKKLWARMLELRNAANKVTS